MTTAYQIKQGGEVAIIGAGGGVDIWRAHLAQSKKITAVEINSGIIELMRGALRKFSSDVYFLKEVEIEYQEGRHYIGHSNKQFDIIQVSFVDTFTPTGTESSTMSESGLYTVQAFREYWQHLKPDGILTFTRWGGKKRGMGEIERASVLAVDMLLKHGVKEPWKHTVILRNPIRKDALMSRGYLSLPRAHEMAVMVVKKSPFTAAELATIKESVALYKQRPLYIPEEKVGPPQFAKFVHATTLAELKEIAEARYQKLYFDLDPPTDDRPYFFSMLRPFDFFSMAEKFPKWNETSPRKDKYIGIKLLLIVVLILFVLSLLFIVGPLFLRPRKAGQTALSLPLLLYFSLLGLGFILIEISVINQFTYLLGHPIYSLAVSLFSMLVFTGIGSLIFSKLKLKHSFFIPLLITVVAFLAWLGYPVLIEAFMQQEIFLSVVVVVLCLAPLSVMMGMGLPLGVSLLSDSLSETIPWAFALNGVFSVTGSTLAIVFSMQEGFKFTFFTGVVCYAVATVSVIAFGLLRRVHSGERFIQR